MIKIEITKKEKEGAEFKLKGGETLDYLAIFSEIIAYLCKEGGIPVDIAVKGLFYELGEAESHN
ncbi:hypothetical protein ACI1TW_09885 [Lactococcus garvieae]|uniref:hypothetical protein n=1 Tax=Lactococcus garvieae TaxID=1363 RepID=UPI0038542F83